MKRFLVALLAFACAGVAAAAAPMIDVAEPIYSITLQTNSLVTHTFLITNIGDETLEISRVSTSCGCTTAALATQSLAPGQSVDLRATVNTTGFKGTVTRTVSVTSNDPVNSVITLQIVVTIAEPAVEGIPVDELAGHFYILIDVRTPEEYAAGHLFGAMNIPLSELQMNLAAWLPRLPLEVPLFLCDDVGVRSLQAASILLQAGVTNVASLTGGLAEWSRVNGEKYLYAPL